MGRNRPKLRRDWLARQGRGYEERPDHDANLRSAGRPALRLVSRWTEWSNKIKQDWTNMLRVGFQFTSRIACLLLALSPAVGAPPTKSATQPKSDFVKEIQPLLSKYCYPCHGEKKKGDLDLRLYTDEKSAGKQRAVFEKVMRNLASHEMPPENKPQPTRAERDLITGWVTATFFPCDCDHPDPGRVTIRRLNRAEYNNTIRDLVGVDFKPADDFPADDSGYGFDNIGDVLSLSPVLLEKYLAAAEKIMDQAIVNGPVWTGPQQKFDAAKMQSTAPGEALSQTARSLTREGEISTAIRCPEAGEYLLRARAYGEQAGPDPARMEFRLDGKAIQVFDVTAVEHSPKTYEIKLRLDPGEKRFSAAYINNYVNPKDPNPANRDRNLIIEYVEIIGPVSLQPVPASHRAIVFCQPTESTKEQCARNIIGSFVRRAFRRPVNEEEVGRFVRVFHEADQGGERFEESIRIALSAVLVSPHFLFRGEMHPEPNNVAATHPVDQYALASRLSYFLWSSMPDAELFREAERGALRRNLEKQVTRMLKDKKSRSFVENFAGQWLQLRDLKLISPDATQFPNFNDQLRAAMLKETELFFEYILVENRSALEFIDANYTFVNQPLAALYGIPAVQGDEFRRVSLKGTRRGGVLSQASVLAITSNPTRTSPVKRGKWVLENILGSPPPPPPANVPELKDDKAAVLSGTLRQRMEQHRDNPACASCHARMDPIGFGFENFDAVGAWRDNEGEFPVDPAGTLVTGESFKGPDGLKQILLKQKRDEFVRCLAEKVLTYGLGRGLEYYDKCAVDEITKRMARDHYKFSTLILEVTKSVPFQMRRGEERPKDLTKQVYQRP